MFLERMSKPYTISWKRYIPGICQRGLIGRILSRGPSWLNKWTLMSLILPIGLMCAIFVAVLDIERCGPQSSTPNKALSRYVSTDSLPFTRNFKLSRGKLGKFCVLLQPNFWVLDQPLPNKTTNKRASLAHQCYDNPL